MCELDLEKTFDHANWNTLVYMLDRYGSREYCLQFSKFPMGYDHEFGAEEILSY